MGVNNRKRETIFSMLDGKCYYCGCDLDINTFNMDHFKAQSQGGRVKDNLVPSCPECNSCKYDLDIEGFRDKLMNKIFNSFHGKLMRKYYGVKPQKIQFYFEKIGGYGNETDSNGGVTDGGVEIEKEPRTIKRGNNVKQARRLSKHGIEG